MKKNLLLTAAFCASLFANETSAQTRYLDEVLLALRLLQMLYTEIIRRY